MKLINPNSLAQTLDAIDDVLFFERSLSKSQKTEAAKWIASRQGLTGSYADMFAPTSKDFNKGVVLFTGEKVITRAGLSHVLGQESSRILKLLNVDSPAVEAALARANTGFCKFMKKNENAKLKHGMYCCAKCSSVFWRRLSAAPLDDSEQILKEGMKTLKSFRDGKGRWNKFPFYYTMLALYDIDLPEAQRELQYAAPVCERIVKRIKKVNKINKRRYMLAVKVLEKC